MTESVEPAAAPAEGARELVNFGELFEKLYPAKQRIAIAGLVAAVVASAVAYTLPNVYTSSASFIPPNLNSGASMAGLLAGQLTSATAGGLLGAVKNSGDLYAGILQSRSISSELVKRFDLMHEYGVPRESAAEKALQSHTKIDVDAKTSIVTLSVTDKSPTRARDLAAAYMEALRDTEGKLALSQSAQRRVFFGEQLAKEKDDLENAEVELKRTQEQSGLIAPTGQTEAEIRTIAETQAQIAGRQVQLASLRQSATEENPNIVRLRSEISDLQGQLTRLQRGSGAGAALTIPTSRVPAVQLEYVRKEREVKYHEALFEMLSKQYEAARLDEAREAPVLQMLDPASLPDTKSGPRRLYFGIGGLPGGTLLAVFWVLLHDRFAAWWAAVRRA